MSSTLYFKRTPKPGTGRLGSCKQPLKGIFAKRYYDHDGSGGGGMLIINEYDLEWLRGVRAATTENADRTLLDKIIKEIEDGNTVDMWFEV